MGCGVVCGAGVSKDKIKELTAMREDALAGFLAAYSKQRARVQALVDGDSGSGSGGAGSAGESKSAAAAGEEESKADSGGAAGSGKAAAAKHIPAALKPFHGKVLKPAELAELYGAWSGLFAP
jgi:hypothetical protein